MRHASLNIIRDSSITIICVPVSCNLSSSSLVEWVGNVQGFMFYLPLQTQIPAMRVEKACTEMTNHCAISFNVTTKFTIVSITLGRISVYSRPLKVDLRRDATGSNKDELMVKSLADQFGIKLGFSRQISTGSIQTGVWNWVSLMQTWCAVIKLGISVHTVSLPWEINGEIHLNVGFWTMLFLANPSGIIRFFCKTDPMSLEQAEQISSNARDATVFFNSIRQNDLSVNPIYHRFFLLRIQR